MLKGAEKRISVELMALKEAQTFNKVAIRWVHSDAQLANSLTKTHELHQIHHFYQTRGHWKIVEDEAARFARNRKQQGLGPLESTKSNIPEVGGMQGRSLKPSYSASARTQGLCTGARIRSQTRSSPAREKCPPAFAIAAHAAPGPLDVPLRGSSSAPGQGLLPFGDRPAQGMPSTRLQASRTKQLALAVVM